MASNLKMGSLRAAIFLIGLSACTTPPRHASSDMARALADSIEERSDPRAVLQAAERMWTGYPFSIADLEVDLDLLERVAEKEADARAALEPPLPSCRTLEAVRDAATAFEAALKMESHRDGGRCARRIYRLFRDLTRDPRTLSADDAEDLIGFLRGMERAFGEDVFTILLGLRLEELWRKRGVPGPDAFKLLEQTDGRWRRLLRGHLAWLRARSGQSTGYSELKEAAQEFRGDSRTDLGRLVAALVEFAGQVDKGAVESLDAAVRGVEAAAPGSVFARAARLGQVEAWMEQKRPREFLAEYRKSPSSNPHEASRILMRVALFFHHDENDDEAAPLLEEILERHPGGAAASLARVTLADLHLGRGNKDHALRLYEQVVRGPLPRDPDMDDEWPDSALSDAVRSLAYLCEERKAWDRSLALWREWRMQTFCGTCYGSMKNERHLHIGLALEHLGRPAEAAKEYWLAAPGSESAAERLFDLQVSGGVLETFRPVAQARIQDALLTDPELDRHPGLSWLAEKLDD